MDIILFKEQLLEIKCKLFKIEQKKNLAVKAHYFEKASGLRFEEKLILQQMDDIKDQIIKAIETFDKDSGNMYDYMKLLELLIEFHSFEFNNDCYYVQSIEAIDEYANKYRELKLQLHIQLNTFIEAACMNISEQIKGFKHEEDKTDIINAVNRLASIGQLLLRHRP